MEFYAMRSKLDDIAREFFEMTQEANARRKQETDAVVRIQSAFRGSVVRQKWHELLKCVSFIERVSRAFLARVRVKAVASARQRNLNLLFFHHCAAVIQKFFRGYWSRKTVHDYFRRKEYLKKVDGRGQWTNAYLQREFDEKLQMQKEEEERVMREEFDSLAGQLHHLVSTSSIPGVYNPPYSDALPRAFDKPIEQHLRDSLRVQIPASLRRPRLRPVVGSASPRARFGPAVRDPVAPPQELPDRGPHMSRTASTGRMQKVQGPFRSKEQIEVANAKAANTFRTIQSSAPYSAIADDRKMQERLAKMTRVAPKDFSAPSACPKPPTLPSSVHANTPYRDRPLELRGDVLELPKIRDKPPFFTAVKMGKQFEDYGERGFLPSGAI